MWSTFSFYSSELDHVKDVELHDIVDGLYFMYQFIHLKHSKTGNFIVLAFIDNLKNIEAQNIKHTYTGTKDDD